MIQRNAKVSLALIMHLSPRFLICNQDNGVQHRGANFGTASVRYQPYANGSETEFQFEIDPLSA